MPIDILPDFLTRASTWSTLNVGQDNSTTSPEDKTKTNSTNQTGKSKRGRPRRIELPSQKLCDSSISPVPQSGSSSAPWGKASFSESLLTPLDSPDGPFDTFWGRGEGSVISSTSSADSSREKLTHSKRFPRLERPLVGRPTDQKERCMSVSLVVGCDGIAQVQREEVEVEFLQSQKEFESGSASFMKRLVSSAGSDVSVSRKLNNLSLVNSTRGEVLVRSASQQTDLSHPLPLTPLLGQSHRFVSPMHLKKESESMLRSASMLPTPESQGYFSSDGEEPDILGESSEVVDDAQLAVKILYDRKQGNATKGFMANSMPLSPMAVPRPWKSTTTCGACQIVFRSRDALAVHSSKCCVKQTPFASVDFFAPVDMFQMTEDMLFMSNFTNSSGGDNVLDPPSLPLGSLLEHALIQNHKAVDIASSMDDLTVKMSPRKKTRFESTPSLPCTPTRSRSYPVLPTSKRKR